MNKFFLLSFIFYFVSCQFTGQTSTLSSNVQVLVAPYGQGDRVRSTNPLIFINGGSFDCRRSPFRFSDARASLEKEKIDPDFLDDFFGEENEEEEEGENADNTDNRAEVKEDNPVRIEVSENWLKFGLWITNLNRGQTNFFLVIDSLTYVATAVRGQEVFTHVGNVNSGYCSGTEGEVAPYLYFVPPGKKIEYAPSSKNPFHNLTIYISGFPIIDRREEPSRRQQQRRNRASSLGSGNSNAGQSLGLQNPLDQIHGSNNIIIIPDYTVELTLRGYFMTKTGIRVSSFINRTSFTTASSLR